MYKKSEIPGNGTGKTGKNIFCTFLYMYIWQKSGGQTGKNIFLYIFVHVHLAKIWWPNRKKHILYIFVHFCTCTFGKNLVAMYKNVVGPPLCNHKITIENYLRGGGGGGGGLTRP